MKTSMHFCTYLKCKMLYIRGKSVLKKGCKYINFVAIIVLLRFLIIHAFSNLFIYFNVFVYCKHLYDSTVKAID